MGWSTSWARRIAEVVGEPERPSPISSNAWRFVANGQEFVAKSGTGVADEAAGLRALAVAEGAPPVPEVILSDEDLLVTCWVPQVSRSNSHEERLGSGLAALHAVSVTHWGGGSSWIGGCRVDPSLCPDPQSFYGNRLLHLAALGGVGGVDVLVQRLPVLIPPGPPALLHGDLWWGNVLWGADGRAWLIDPSVHYGHPEEDLAMLALFGEVPARLLDAYQEVRPLESGWPERVSLWQLYPLLVHTVLFGGGYRAQAEAVVRRYA